MINVLPNPMICMRGHGFVKLRPLHGLNRRCHLCSAKSQSGSSSRCNDCNPHTFCGDLESLKVVGWFAFFSHGRL